MPENDRSQTDAAAHLRSPDHPEEPARCALICGLALMVLTLAAYLPVIAEGGYIWDDDDYLTENQYVQAPDGIDEIWELDPFERSNTRQYYPMVFTTFWIEHALWGLDHPEGYHLVNVLLHALNAVLLWRLLVMLRVPGAWIAAAIFALHPVHVESVAWITERKNVLSLFFYLTAAWAYLRFDDLREKTEPDDRRNVWGWYGAALVLFAAALLSKSVTCSLPAALILVHLWQRKRLTLGRLAWLVPFFILGLLLALNTAMLERVQVGATGEAFDLSFIERSLVASKALLFYPWKMIVPMPLMFIYPRWAIDAGNIVTYWSIILVLLIAAGCIVLYARGRRGVPLAIAFYAGTIFPALGFFNVYPHLFSFVADHFVYHASIGLIVLAGAGVAILLTKPLVRAAVMVVPLFLLFLLTWRQGLMYQNSKALWRTTIEQNPDAWMAHNNLAGDLLREAERLIAAGRADDATDTIEEARYHASVAVDIKPDHHTALANLAESLRLLGRPAEGIPHLEEAVRLRPGLPEHRWKLGRLYHLMQRYDDAIDQYRAAIDALEQQPLPAGALAQRNDYRFYSLELGRLLFALERFEEARPHLERVARSQPDQFGALLPLAQMAERRGDAAGAARWYRQIIEQRAARTPHDQAQFLTNYIRFLSTVADERFRDVGRALELAERAAEMSARSDPSVLLMLASVQDIAGNRAAARQTAEQALRLAETMNLPHIAEQARQMLESMGENATPDDNSSPGAQREPDD